MPHVDSTQYLPYTALEWYHDHNAILQSKSKEKYCAELFTSNQPGPKLLWNNYPPKKRKYLRFHRIAEASARLFTLILRSQSLVNCSFIGDDQSRSSLHRGQEMLPKYCRDFRQELSKPISMRISSICRSLPVDLDHPNYHAHAHPRLHY